MLKKLGQKRIVLIVIFSLGVLSGGLALAVSSYHAGADVANVGSEVDAQCRRGIVSGKISTATILPYMDSTYHVNRVATSPSVTSTEPTIQLDFDTYGQSWESYTGGKEAGIEARQKLKNLAPNALTEITKIYGAPFQSGTINVVYTPNLQNDVNLNPSGISDASGLFVPWDNVLILSDEVEEQVFYHEMVHAFNHGTLPIDAYEEGLAESVSQILMTRVHAGTNNVLLSDGSRRFMLASSVGFFRTMPDGELVGNRYRAAADAFYNFYLIDPSFYKTYRANLQKNQYYAPLLDDSRQTVTKIIGDSMCALLSNRAGGDKLLKFVQEMENVLVSSLPSEYQAAIKRSNTANPFSSIKNHPILNIIPGRGVYTDIQLDEFYQSFVAHASYKRSLDLLEAMYRMYFDYTTIPGDKDPNHANFINLAKIVRFARTLSFDNISKISTLAQSAIEESVDLASTVFTSPDSTQVYTLTSNPEVVPTPLPPDNPKKPVIDKPLIDQVLKEQSSKQLTESEMSQLLAQTLAQTHVDSPSITGISTKNSFVALTSTKTVLNKLNLPLNYTGFITVAVTAQKNTFRVTQKNSCAKLGPFALDCWPDGLRADPDLQKWSTTTKFAVANGKAVNLQSASDSVPVPASIVAKPVLTGKGSSADITLNWAIPNTTDTIARYDIYRNNTQTGSSAGPEFVDHLATFDTPVAYYVIAVNSTGSFSHNSAVFVVNPTMLKRQLTADFCIDGTDTLEFANDQVQIKHQRYRPIGEGGACGKLGNTAKMGIVTGSLAGCQTVTLDVVEGRGSVILNSNKFPYTTTIVDGQGGAAIYRLNYSCMIPFESSQ